MSDLTTIATGILPASGYKAGVVYGIGLDNYTYLTLAELKEHVFYDGIKHALTGYAIDRMYYFDSNKGSYIIRFRDGVYQLAIQSDAFDFTSTRNGPAYRTNENGVLEEMGNDVCRVDYSGGGCPSLLLEPSSTNLVLWSEEFSNIYWSGYNCDILQSNLVCPDGSQNSYKLVPDLVDNRHAMYRNSIPIVGHIHSVYAKKAEYDYLLISSSATSAPLNRGTVFNLNTGTIESQINPQYAEIIDAGDGWYRCSIGENGVLDSTVFALLPMPDATTDAYAGDGVSGIYVWGCQSEAGTGETSYIKTEGTTVTRPQDTLAQTTPNSDMYNDAEGVFMVDARLLYDDAFNKVITCGNSVSDGRIHFQWRATPNEVRFLVNNGVDVSYEFITLLDDTKSFNKLAIRYALNNFSTWVNGVKINESLSGATISTVLNQVALSSNTGTSYFFGECKSVAYFPSFLTDEEMATLTT